MTYKTNEIVKGDLVKLRNGWEADIMDGYKNRKTRLAKVYGLYTEIGSVYAHDIVAVQRDGTWINVESTDRAKEFKSQISHLGW